MGIAGKIIGGVLILGAAAAAVFGTRKEHKKPHEQCSCLHERCICSPWMELLGFWVVEAWANKHPDVHIDSKKEQEILAEYRRLHPDVNLCETYTGQKIEW